VLRHMKIISISWLVMLVSCSNSAAPNVFVQPPKNETKIVSQGDNLKPSDVLLKVSYDGGLVPDRKSISGGHTGHSEFVVTRDGKYSIDGDVAPKSKGELQGSDLNELVGQINDADFVALRSRKFTGECPTAYDGVEVTYSFHTRTGVEIIASCEVEIDAKSPLFIKVGEILKEYR
jgi:hypothetical protein